MAVENLVRAFLADRPQYIDGSRAAEVYGEQDILLDTDTAVAFAEWCVARGWTTADKVATLKKRMAEEVEHRCPTGGYTPGA